MDFTVSCTDGRIHLAGEITIYAAAALKEQLFAFIEPGRPVEVDASAVTMFDSAGLQLFLMMRKTGGTMRVFAPSEVVRDALAMCGLDALIAARVAS